ncbi:MAG: hypothetical protein ACK4WM_07425 [Thermoflexales bacterium]
MMHLFNRAFVIVTLVVLIPLGAFTLLWPAGMLSLMHTLADTARITFFAGFTDIGRFITRVSLAIVWVAVLGSLLWLETRRGTSRTIEVARYSGDNTLRISTEAVAEKLSENIHALEGVIHAKVKAKGRDRAVEISVEVTTSRDTDLVMKAEEVANLVRHIVQTELGLRLAGKPQVSIKAKEGVVRRPLPLPASDLPNNAAGEAAEAAQRLEQDNA